MKTLDKASPKGVWSGLPSRATSTTLDREPGPMSSPGRYARQLAKLPDAVPALARVVQGIAIHEYMAAAYGFTVPQKRKGESHIRTAEAMLQRVLGLDEQPLSAARLRKNA